MATVCPGPSVLADRERVGGSAERESQIEIVNINFAQDEGAKVVRRDGVTNGK